MKLKTLRNMFISVGVLFNLARLLAAGTSDGILNFGDSASAGIAIITFDAPGAGTDPGEGTLAFAINPAGTIAGQYLIRVL